MTPDALDRIERELGLKLPASYREIVQSAEFGEGCQEFYGSADEVIERTKENRKRGFYGSKWPETYLVIGDDGAGDDYFCDCVNPHPAVRFADHETTTNDGGLSFNEKETYDTFQVFWENMKRLSEETRLWFERRRNKRWWQFWIR